MSTEPQTPQAATDEADPASADAERRRHYLKTELGRRIKWFDTESKSHKRLFRRLRYAVFGLTALSSALAGLALAIPDIQTFVTAVIIVTTAVAGIVTSVEGLRKPNELWIHERTIYYSLLDLKRDVDYQQADSNTTDEHFQRLQSILGSSGSKWRDIVPSAAPAAGKDGALRPGGNSP